MKTIKFEIVMEVEDNFAEKAKRWEHHAEEILDLDSYPEIKGVYGCRVTKMENFFDIHVKHGENRGYSVFIQAKDKTEALKKCIDNNMFAEDGDEDYIDNITEISEEEYNYAINA